MLPWSVVAVPLASTIVALGSQDPQGEMEVLLMGRAGLGKDYRVSFNYQIAIW